MRNEDLMRIVSDPDLRDPATARVLIQLARQAARSDDDIAGDVLVALTEKLRDGGTLRGRLTSHANPPALLARAAANAARDAWDHASRFKRDLPLTPDGDLTALESPDRASSPTYGPLDLLEDLGWTVPHLEMLALPRKRPACSVHPGIEDGVERLASCFGITKRCPGCPTEDDLLRVDLRGPSSWPHLVPVLREWGWSDDLIDYVTTSPSSIDHWQTLDLRPPARQERRMVEIVRKMRVEPWLLRDTDAIRESVRTTRGGPPRQSLAALRGWRECSMAS
jgi:hypothetical protein